MNKLTINSDWVDFNYESDSKIYLSVDRLAYSSRHNINILVLCEPLRATRLSEDKIKKNYKKWDYILTWNHNLLNLPNSILFEFGTSWIPEGEENVKKEYFCSMICGDKNFMPGHIKRAKIFKELLDYNDIIKFASKGSAWKKNNPSLLELEVEVDRLSAFKSYFHICLENCSEKYYFTEKIIDCFITKTIPVYWGCPNISEYFNPKGIIFIDNFNNTHDLVKHLLNIKYEDFSSCVEENYSLALKYKNFNKRLIDKLNLILMEKRNHP